MCYWALPSVLPSLKLAKTVDGRNGTINAENLSIGETRVWVSIVLDGNFLTPDLGDKENMEKGVGFLQNGKTKVTWRKGFSRAVWGGFWVGALPCHFWRLEWVDVWISFNKEPSCWKWGHFTLDMFVCCSRPGMMYAGCTEDPLVGILIGLVYLPPQKTEHLLSEMILLKHFISLG